MSEMKPVLIAMALYYTVIFGGRELMRNRPAFKLKGPFIVHNFYLTAISGTLLALLLEQLIPEIARNGIFHAICHPEGGWTNKLVMLYYVRIVGSKTAVQIETNGILAELPHQIRRVH